MSLGVEIRNARLGAVCAAFLVCVLSVAASASDDAAANKSAHPASSAKSKSAKHHASTAPGTATSKTHTASSKRHKKSSRVRGQQKIDGERAQAIQEALIREHYLNGEATGTWTPASEEAMRRFQADNGWQSKTVPDSRALIKLGLGPSKDHLLNPESAMTTVPDAPKTGSLPTTSHTPPVVANPVPPAAPSSTPVSSNSSRPQ